MKLKLLACATCLLLFVAAIDNVPDPPAIQQRTADSAGISMLHVPGPSTPSKEEKVVASGSPLHIQITWFSFQFAFDSECIGTCPLPLVRHASDPSPPIYF
jgi:hypothetical protein